MNNKGQFFSPDLVIAIGIFILTLALFWAASNVVFEQVDLINTHKKADETVHSIMDSIVLSSGVPKNWETLSIFDINSFGLVHSNNILDVNKTVTLVNLLNSEDYSLVKYKLGAGKYALQLNVLDSKGEVIEDPIRLSGGQIVVEPIIKLAYLRIVHYNNESALMQVIVSVEE